MTHHPCPVCSGHGGWSRDTYKPQTRPLIDAGPFGSWVRCMYCNGTGSNPRPVEAVR